MKNKNFLKKLTAGILGFVMTLGVGAAGYAGAASETKAASSFVELCTSWNKTLAYTTAYTQEYTINNLAGSTTKMTLAVTGVYRQSNANTYFQMNKKTGYFKNTTKLPGKITKIETTWNNAKGPTKCYFASSAEASSTDSTVTVTAATSVTYTPASGSDYYYFNIDTSTGSGSAQLTSCVVYYETASAAKELSSISVKTAPTKTVYAQGDNFDPSGLVITRTYTDKTTDELNYDDNPSEFTFSPTTSTPLATTNTSVTITVGGKTTSQSITVKQKYNVTLNAGKGTGSAVSHGSFAVLNTAPACPDSFSCTGKSFDHWSTSPTSDVKASFPMEINSATTLYAIWVKQGNYVKVTSTADLTDGKYLIVCEGANVALKGTLNADDTNNGVSVTIVTDSSTGAKSIVPTPELNDEAFTFEADSGTFLGSSGKYVGHTGSSNTLNYSDDGLENVITFDSGDAVITAGDYVMRYNNNSGQYRFRYYKSGQTAVQLYKLSSAKYTVTFNPKGAEFKTGVSNKAEVEPGSPVTLLNANDFVARTGFEFGGWSTTDGGTTPVTAPFTPEDDITLYAIWTSTRSLLSISISGSLNTSTYFTTDTSWSREGLAAVATYTDGDENISDSATWTFDPEVPSYGVESVEISISFSGKSASETYDVTVNKVKLGTPSPVYSSRQISWDDISGATAYYGRFGGTGNYSEVESPLDVGQYSGDGSLTFEIYAVGDTDIYNQSNTGSCTFEVPAVTYYQLVTSTDELIAGQDYTIGSYTGSSWNVMSTTEKNGNRATLSTTIDDGKIFDDNILNLTLGGDSTNGYTFLTTNYGTVGTTTQGYLNATGTTGSNTLNVVAEENEYGFFDISIESGVTWITCNGKSERHQMFMNGDIISCYTSQQPQSGAAYKNVALFKKVSTAKTISINKSQVSGFITQSDNSVTVTCGNFTPTINDISVSYADGGNESSSHILTSNIVSITPTISDNVYTLAISFIAPGSTNVKIDISAGNNNIKTTYLNVTAYAEPASIKVGAGSGISEAEIQVVSGEEKASIQPSVTVLDSSGQPVAGASWKREFVSGSDYAELSATTKITAKAVGDAVVKYTAVVNDVEFEKVYKVVTFHCIADYIETVTSISFDDAIVATQGDVIGDQIDIRKIITSAKGTTHFGSTNQDVDLSQFSFSYTQNRNDAKKDFAFNTPITVDTDETVYVFHDRDSNFMELFIACVEPAEYPITGIEFDNQGFTKTSEGQYTANVNLGTTVVLNAYVIPTNTTAESKEITYTIVSQTSGGDAVLDGNSLNVGTLFENNIKVSATSVEDSDIVTYVDITVTRAEQKVTVDETLEESWSAATSVGVGDTIVLYNAEAGRELTGIASNIGTATTYTDSPSCSYEINIGKGSSDGYYTLHTSDGYLCLTKDDNKINVLEQIDSSNPNQCDWTIEIDDSGNIEITNIAYSTRIIRYNKNSGQERFATYKGTQQLIQALKKSGGPSQTELTVNDDLYKAAVAANKIIANGEMTSEKWSSIDDLFTTLMATEGSDAYRILTKGVGNASGNDVERFLDSYDSLVPMYSTNNFLLRTINIVITFDSAGGSEVPSQKLNPGDKVTRPEDPTKDGYTFIGWFNGDKLYDFNSNVTGSLTLTAKWSNATYVDVDEMASVEITTGINFDYQTVGTTVQSVSNVKIRFAAAMNDEALAAYDKEGFTYGMILLKTDELAGQDLNELFENLGCDIQVLLDQFEYSKSGTWDDMASPNNKTKIPEFGANLKITDFTSAGLDQSYTCIWYAYDSSTNTYYVAGSCEESLRHILTELLKNYEEGSEMYNLINYILTGGDK